MSMIRRYVRIASVLLLALVLALTSASGALASDAVKPLPSDIEVQDIIVGNAAGAFHYYEIAYPGGDVVLDVTLWYAPADPVTSTAFGLNVYGYNGFQGQGTPDASGNPGVLAFSYSADDATTLLLQIYNYLDGAAVSYGIAATGLPEAPTTTTEPVATAPKPAAVETTLVAGSGQHSGTLVGNPAGAFVMYEIAYPGDEIVLTIELRYSPADAVTSSAFGLNVYSYGGFSGRGEPKADGEPGVFEFSYSSADATTLVVQVYNYLDGCPVSFTLSWAQ